MTVKKSALKQYLKFLLQKTLLPFCYNFCSSRSEDIDEKLIIFADSNSDEPPESMTRLMSELRRRGYVCEEHFMDFSQSGFFGMIKFMLNFMKRYAAARGVVVCNYFVPLHACKKRRETTVVQIWHSCGILKKFGYSAAADIPDSFKGSVSANIDTVTVSAPVCEKYFSEAFHLKKGVARAVGVSRSDMFFDDDFKTAALQKLKKLYPSAADGKLLLWLPTFRGDAAHGVCAGYEDIKKLSGRLTDFRVIVRMHPRTENAVTEFPLMTTNELLVCADMLITDYSSAIFEYVLLDRPMVLFCPDYDEYAEERGFYIDFKKEMPCPIVTSADKLYEAVTNESQRFRSGGYKRFADRYMSACDGGSTERIADLFRQDDNRILKER